MIGGRVRPWRLAAFAGFGALAAVQWGSLLAEPPLVRLGLVALIALVTALTLAALAGVVTGSRPRRRSATAIVAVAGLAASLAALGVPAGELAPWGWARLGSDVDRGFAGLAGSFDYPFPAGNDSSRLLLLVGMPLLLLLAAVLGFRPGRPPGRGADALLVLIAAFAIPATVRPTSAPIAWGLALLALAALWIWERPTRGAAAFATIACFGAVAVPVASGMAGDDPLIDYRGWSLPDPAAGLEYEWDQRYGPIDWPRTSELLFEVRSEQPRYWRAEVLDDFYGFGWKRSSAGGEAVPEEVDSPGAPLDPRWLQTARFSIGSLRSPLVVSPGSAVDVRGVSDTVRDPDGTVHSDADPLTEGSEYSVTAYAPDPGPALMRAGSRSYPGRLDFYTTLAIPYGTVDPPSGLVTVHRVAMPLWGHRAKGPGAVAEIASSPYARVARLARRLTASEPTAYDAARAVEEHLRAGYRYEETPPPRQVPLRAFLFRDRAGYCQQFSGAMALMLRLSGIPARVAAGFAPGRRESEQADFAVTGLDAHSWVEVYFEGIGWVTFDPTPSSAPAQSQAGGRGAPRSELGALGSDDRAAARAREPDFSNGRAAAVPDEDSQGPAWSLLLVLVIPAGGAALLSIVRTFRHRSLSEQAVAELQLRELAAALAPAGLAGPEPTTLHRLEEQLRRRRLLAAAAYVGRLGALRFARSAGSPPTLAERRATRRELSSGGGVGRSVRMLVAMPPGGPRR